MSGINSIEDIEHTFWWSVASSGHFNNEDRSTSHARANAALARLRHYMRELPPPPRYVPNMIDAEQQMDDLQAL